MDVFHAKRNFPKEEKYSLTDQLYGHQDQSPQILRKDGGKRIYENEFKKHLIYSMGSLEESKVWLLFAKDCGYISVETFNALSLKYDQIGSKVYRLYENWKTL